MRLAVGVFRLVFAYSLLAGLLLASSEVILGIMAIGIVLPFEGYSFLLAKRLPPTEAQDQAAVAVFSGGLVLAVYGVFLVQAEAWLSLGSMFMAGVLICCGIWWHLR
ncbi:MAG: hypothetical protein JRN21_09890 [Nitrososphaerota archaeon]|nr:hypothetical protein [Nitrososphaerota archaeon]